MVSIVSNLRKVSDFILAFTPKNAPIYTKLEMAKKQMSFKPEFSMNLINDALTIIENHPLKNIKISPAGKEPSITLYTKYTELVKAAKKAIEEFQGGKADKRVDVDKNLDEAMKLVEDAAPFIEQMQKPSLKKQVIQ